MPNYTIMLSLKFYYGKNSKYGTYKFKDFPRTFKDLLCFQGLSRALNFFSKFKDFQGLLKDPMNPD